MPKGKSFMVVAKFFIQQSFTHSFIYSVHLPVPLQTQTPQGTLASQRTADEASEQLVEAQNLGGTPNHQNQQCPSPTLGIAGVSPLPPPFSHSASRK